MAVSSRGGSMLMPRATTAMPMANPAASDRYRNTMADGFWAEKIVLPKPMKRSVATAKMVRPSAKARLCRVVAGEPRNAYASPVKASGNNGGARRPVVELGAERAGLHAVHQIVGIRRRRQLPQVALARSDAAHVAGAREARQVEGVALERHDGGIALVDLAALNAPALEHEERAAVVFQDIAALGEEGGALLGVTAIVDKDAHQLAVRPAVADVERQAAFDGAEAAGLDDGRD